MSDERERTDPGADGDETPMSDGTPLGGERPAAGEPNPGTMSMADYREAMSDRNIHARNRGLQAPFIAGGRDPDPEAGRREERFYLRLLIAMCALIVVGGLVLAIVGYVVTGGAGFGGG